MKRLIFILVAAICGLRTVRATDNIVVPNLTISQGGEGLIDIQLNNELPYVTFAFTLNLPEGINYVDMEVSEERFAPQAGEYLPIKDPSDDGRSIGLGSLAITENSFAGNSGTLVTVKITADETLEIGTILNATITGIKFSTNDEEKPLADIAFTITIGEPADTRTILDENSTTAPTNATGVDVRVLRTIKANEWSTICLPFAMSESKVKAVFGNDVELANFSSWLSEEDDDGNIVSITIGFTDVTEIEANHPYIIKVAEAISEFTIDGVNIEVEEEPTVQVGKKKAERGYFTGCYLAKTVVPENNLFLNGNKFWYSKGLTKMKAFRGYFELADVLTSVEEAGSRIMMSFNSETTGIRDVNGKKEDVRCAVYDLQGRKVLKPVKGLYIKNGRKEVVK
jgi:hypothetical protein